MGNPAYDARRAAEQSIAERDKAAADMGKTAVEALQDFLNGKARIAIQPLVTGGHSIRLVRDDGP